MLARLFATQCGDKVGDAVKQTIRSTLAAALEDSNDDLRASAAHGLGGLAPYVSQDVLSSMVDEALQPASGNTQHAHMALLAGA